MKSSSRTNFCNIFVHQFNYKKIYLFACDLKIHDHSTFVHTEKCDKVILRSQKHLQFVLWALFNLPNPENIVSSGNIVMCNFALTNLVQWIKYTKLLQISYRTVCSLDDISHLVTMSSDIHVRNKTPLLDLEWESIYLELKRWCIIKSWVYTDEKIQIYTCCVVCVQGSFSRNNHSTPLVFFSGSSLR